MLIRWTLYKRTPKVTHEKNFSNLKNIGLPGGPFCMKGKFKHLTMKINIASFFAVAAVVVAAACSSKPAETATDVDSTATETVAPEPVAPAATDTTATDTTATAAPAH
jgi:hypothetical protein